ncbi:MAG: ATP-dependent RecD-like DNA helicase [Chloroflexi bacterium]|nr:ATP-dependent RecD-like DNA helicase [Chloroflexota bacterium]
MNIGDSATLTGAIERIIFQGPDAGNGYVVASFQPEGELFPITVVGTMLDVRLEEPVEVQGTWVRHPRYGEQLKVHELRYVLPATTQGIAAYLSSGLIEGVGPVLARRIVDRFGVATPNIIDHYPERLSEVSGIGPKRAKAIAESWRERREINDVMMFLRGLGIGPETAVSIYRCYGRETEAAVRRNPYQLIYDVRGIGFTKADGIARHLGVAQDGEERVQAGVYHVLQECVSDGHVYVPWDDLAQRARDLLQVGAELVQEAIEQLRSARRIHVEESLWVGGQAAEVTVQRGVYLTRLHTHEETSARHLCGLARASSGLAIPNPPPGGWATLLAALPGAGIELTVEQESAVISALTHKVTVLTGGPGTGKTSAVQTLIASLEHFGHGADDYVLAAPTGRAAKRLADLTGREASTIHRLLEVQPLSGGGFVFTRNALCPLDAGMVIVDESSMMDVALFHHLVEAIRPGAHLLLVGDVDQLPPVGPGIPLRDIISSGLAHVVRLTTIHRQAEDSYIVRNAHRINGGQMPILSEECSDFFLLSAEAQGEIADNVVSLVQSRIPGYFGVRPEDIQVLSPTYRGAAGVDALNARLQEALNPAVLGEPTLVHGRRAFRAGDRVMQTRNDYKLDAYNGDIGYVESVHPQDGVMYVNVDGRTVEYDMGTVANLTHAFACTIHKAQGSEYPVVVVALHPAHYVLLQRNLLYTAVTRAQQVVVIVGAQKAIGMAVNNNRVATRYSALAERLRGGSSCV